MSKAIIPMGSTSLDIQAFKTLVKHCKEHELDIKTLFIYESEGELIAGFKGDKTLHVRLHSNNWRPVYKC